MTIPAWLDPWWHLDFAVGSALSADAAAVALRPRSGRLRGRQAKDGALVLVRRGRLINEFVRARATVVGDGAGSTAQVRIARPAWVVALMALMLVGLVLWPLLGILVTLVFDRQRLLQSLVLFVAGAVIWVSVIGMNYTSARSEARDLQRLIGQALGDNP